MQQLFSVFGFSVLALGASTSLGTKSLTRLRGMAPDAALAAIRALDTDGSGKVEKNEVEAFARQQGLSADQVSLEFKELDVNGDGELEEDEISTSLLSQPQPTQKVSFPQTIQTETVAPTAKVVSAPAVPAAPAASASRVESELTADVESATVAKADSSTNMEHETISTANVSHTAGSTLAVADLIQEDLMLSKAKEQASRAVAEAFAGSASAAFSSQQADDSQAQNLTKLAKSLRGKAAVLASNAQEQVQAAAAQAAAAVLEEQAPKVLRMQQQAANLTADADERRKKAKETMEKVMKAQAEMREMVDPQPKM